MKVPYTDMGAQYRALAHEIDPATRRVLASGRYIGGHEVERFEERMASYLGTRHVIGVGNGYDALFLAIKSLCLPRGSLVSTDAYTHVSTHAAIAANGHEVVFYGEADAWLPVHMNGRIRIGFNAKPDIEDACQVLGATLAGRKAGTFGLMGCFSCHPLKLLSGAGDGGFICTDSDSHAARLRELRNHGGGKGYGVNSRLDALQAAILAVKLEHIGEFIAARRRIAQCYDDGLVWEAKPEPPSSGTHFDVYTSYVIGADQDLLRHLHDAGIEAFSHIRTDLVSLPIYPEMPQDHIDYVIETVNGYARTHNRI